MIEAYHRLSKLNEYSAIDFTGDSTAATRCRNSLIPKKGHT